MTVEVDVVTLLRTLCPRVHPLTAPLSTQRPFVTYQHVGGNVMRYTDGTAAAKRHALVQINVWDSTLAGSLALIRQIEDLLYATPVLQAEMLGEVIDQLDDELGIYGTLATFSILADRS